MTTIEMELSSSWPPSVRYLHWEPLCPFPEPGYARLAAMPANLRSLRGWATIIGSVHREIVPFTHYSRPGSLAPGFWSRCAESSWYWP